MNNRLELEIQRLSQATTFSENTLQTFLDFRKALESGEIRAAEPGDDGEWRVNTWVKQGILLGFRIGKRVQSQSGLFPFFDKDTWPLQSLDLASGIRIVPGGSAIRSGAYVAPSVVCMPPMYVNVGAFVGAGTLIDSHALVGSCAQIGSNVHLSAAAQIGGVIEPMGALPVIIEDDVFIGGNSGVYEGCIVRSRAVLAAGVVLTGSSRVFDLVNERVLEAEAGGALEIPSGAVVVSGNRPAKGAFAEDNGLSLYTPVIVKYRDAKTDAATALEGAIR